jgi:hypothetical protein
MITKFVMSLIVLLVVSITALGQVTVERPSTDSKADQELKAKALLLLAETSQQMRGLKNRENQIASRIGLANLMWADQEASARRLYREAFDILRESSDSIAENEMELPSSSRSLFQLRTRLVESLGEHDPIMARELLRQMTIKNSEDATGNDKDDADGKGVESKSDGEAQRLEMKLTAEMADRNPEEAVRAARESLSKEISFDTYLMIKKLAIRDPKIASELAGELVDKLRKADYKKDHDAIEMAMFLIRDEATSLVLADAPKQEDGQEEKRASLLDQETLRGFVEFIVDASLKKDYGEYLLYNLQAIQGEIDKVAPAQAARIKQKWADLEKEYPELGRQNRFREATESNDAQQMLEIAQAAEPEMRDSLYSRAASAAWTQGDKARAIEIVTKNISSPDERKRQLALFHDLAISESMTNGDFAEARKLIAQTSKSDERIRQLLDLADAQAAKGDRKVALEILNELQGLFPAKPRNSSELDFQIRLAETFAVVDPDRSFTLLSSTIDQINDLMDAAARVANFISPSASIKDNEFDIESYGSVPGLDMLLSQRVKTLATVDFAKTRSLFDKIQRPEIRLAAYLHLSRVILEPERECTCTCPNPAKKQDKPVER